MALAKWYKIDFHTHTPESKCFPDKKVTPKEWLKSAKESGINAVVVSDHNRSSRTKILRYFMELNFVYLRILHIFSLFLMIRCP